MRQPWLTYVCFLVAVFMITACAQMVFAADEPELIIDVQSLDQGGIRLQASLGSTTKSVEIDSAGTENLAAIRFSVECEFGEDCEGQAVQPVEGKRKRLDEAALKAELGDLGRKILLPLANEIRRAKQLRINLPQSLAKLPLDALELEGEPLFILKPCCLLDWREDYPVQPARQQVVERIAVVG